MKLHQSEDNENALIDEAVIDGICRLARVAPTFVWRASLVKKRKNRFKCVLRCGAVGSHLCKQG